MARPKQEAPDAPEVTESAAPKFVLKKNHGLMTHGRTHQHFTAGTEFDPIKDGALITQLVQSGALFE